MDERSRRQWAAAEAREHGYGGVTAVARATGLARNTIAAGIRELEYREQHPDEPVPARLRNSGAGSPREEYEFNAGEADEDVYDGETVVLDPFVREAILLELPNFPLCSASCAGIRPAPPTGEQKPAEPPVDPRLAPLGALRDRLASRPAAPAGKARPRAPRKTTKE